MTIDHGNRGERLSGVRYAEQDPVADCFAYDRLPKRLRKIFREAPARLNATETLRALDEFSERQVETMVLLGIKKWMDAAVAERRQLS